MCISTVDDLKGGVISPKRYRELQGGWAAFASRTTGRAVLDTSVRKLALRIFRRVTATAAVAATTAAALWLEGILCWGRARTQSGRKWLSVYADAARVIRLLHLLRRHELLLGRLGRDRLVIVSGVSSDIGGTVSQRCTIAACAIIRPFGRFATDVRHIWRAARNLAANAVRAVETVRVARVIVAGEMSSWREVHSILL